MAEAAGEIRFRDFSQSQYRGCRRHEVSCCCSNYSVLAQQYLLTLMVRVAVAASLASILSRSGAFQRMLMRDDRTLVQRVKLSLILSLAYGASVMTRFLPGI